MDNLSQLLIDVEKYGSIKFLIDIEELNLNSKKIIEVMRQSSELFVNILVELIYNYDLSFEDFILNGEDEENVKHLANLDPRYAYIFSLIYGEDIYQIDEYQELNINYDENKLSGDFLKIAQVINAYDIYNQSGIYNTHMDLSNLHRIPKFLSELRKDNPFIIKKLTDDDMISYDIYLPGADLYKVFERLKFLKQNADIYYQVCKKTYLKILKDYANMNRTNQLKYLSQIGRLGENIQ